MGYISQAQLEELQAWVNENFKMLFVQIVVHGVNACYAT